MAPEIGCRILSIIIVYQDLTCVEFDCNITLNDHSTCFEIIKVGFKNISVDFLFSYEKVALFISYSLLQIKTHMVGCARQPHNWSYHL